MTDHERRCAGPLPPPTDRRTRSTVPLGSQAMMQWLRLLAACLLGDLRGVTQPSSGSYLSHRFYQRDSTIDPLIRHVWHGPAGKIRGLGVERRTRSHEMTSGGEGVCGSARDGALSEVGGDRT